MSDKEYTLVINGDCPALRMDTAVYLQTDGIQSFAGVVDSVLFKGNALSENENLITELESKNKEIERYEVVVGQFNDLMGESEGVAGLHLNGDIADWDWLQNEWLSELSNLRNP